MDLITHIRTSGAYEPLKAAKERISYVIRVVTSKISKPCRPGTKKLSNMVHLCTYREAVTSTMSTATARFIYRYDALVRSFAAFGGSCAPGTYTICLSNTKWSCCWVISNAFQVFQGSAFVGSIAVCFIMKVTCANVN